jgi:hypothetical protein
MKITALLAVKNEAWALDACLKSLAFCDEILVIDDGSTDATPEILKQYNCTVLELDTAASIGWKEFQIRSHLLHEARKRGATHLVVLDGDEAVSRSFQEDARSILARMSPGEALRLEWLNLCSATTYKKPKIPKDFVYCDNGTSQYQEAFLGVSRVPSASRITEIEWPHCILHFQYLNPQRLAYKQAWYRMSELLKGDRSARRINATYAHTKSVRCAARDLSAAVSGIQLPNPSSDAGIWYKDEIRKLFDTYGIERFEPADIWDIVELKQQFTARAGRAPRPHRFPKILLVANDFKNKIRNLLRSA